MVTTPTRQAEPNLPTLGPVGWMRWAWRSLTSMRTALLLLLMLAIAAVPGSIFPQRGVDPTKVAEFIADNPTTSRWLDRLGFFDVYSSPWFSAIYLLLFISLIGCVIPRTRVHLAAMRARPPRTPARLERLPAYVERGTDLVPQEVSSRAVQVLRRRRYRVDLRADGSVSAERGYLRETGNLLFHVALLGLLFALAASSLFSYRGQAIITQGQGFANVVSQYDSIDLGAGVDDNDLQPFRLTLDGLTARFETAAGGNQFAAARDFEATVTVVERPGAEPRHEVIKVNHPLDIDGASVYLQGNGYAPIITVRDGTGRVVSSGPVVFLAQDAMYTSTGVVKVPDMSPQLGLQGVFLPSMDVRNGQAVSVFPDQLNPRLLLNVWTGDLGLDQGAPQSVYRLDTDALTQLQQDGRPYTAMLAPGDSVTLPDGLGSVTLERVDRFAALQFRTDPARGWALGFAALAMLGLATSLFVPRRRVWVRPVGGQGRTLIQVAALARSDDPRLGAEVDEVMAGVAGHDDDERVT
ncbi:MAG: cytochrome c biogenesis protein ResB [Actinomycetales bacterium]